MIIGKNSAWKMLALLAIAAALCLDVIFSTRKLVDIVNCTIVVLGGVLGALLLYDRWREKA